MIDKIKEILQTNETEISQSEFTHWGVLDDKYDDVAEQIENLFSIHDVSDSVKEAYQKGFNDGASAAVDSIAANPERL